MSWTKLNCIKKETDVSRIDQTKKIFEEALQAFHSEFSKDKTKLKYLQDPKLGSFEKVLAAVIEARDKYNARKGDSVIRQKLCELAEKIHHYGGIVDVMVQQHPEYVSLIWGAMKILFVVSQKRP